MPQGGELRTELSSTLSAAYARGLLSEHTFMTRLEVLLREPVVTPEQLVGDLHLRGPESSFRDRLARTVSAVAGRAETLWQDAYEDPPVVLGLDWVGPSDDLLIGRSSHCDVVLSDSTVSRTHARLRFRDGGWTLQDLDSTNGTSLNGRRVRRSELRPGDRLALGYFKLCVD